MLDQETTYLPRGERPAPYPPGMIPRDPRWTGERFTRVGKPAEGLAPEDARPAPVPDRPTALNSTVERNIEADQLPVVGRMMLVTAVSDDPGWQAIHGMRLSGEYELFPETGSGPNPDLPRARRRRRWAVPVGSVLVSRAGGGDAPRGWRIWRVPPAGPACLLEEVVREDSHGNDRVALARAIDRDLREAFDRCIERLEAQEDADLVLARVKPPIAAWRLHVDAPRRRGGRKARRRRRRA